MPEVHHNHLQVIAITRLIVYCLITILLLLHVARCLQSPFATVFFVLFAVNLIKHYWSCCVSKSQLYAYTVGSFGDLVRKFVSVKRTFYPNVFCMSAFSQTHFATLIRYFNVKSGKFSNEDFMCSDDFIVPLKWLIGAPHPQFAHEINEIKPIALFVPNLFDNPHNPLITSLCTIAHEVGYRPVFFDHRGCFKLFPISKSIKHDSTDHLKEVIIYLKQKYHTRLIVIGVGLGSTLTANYLIRHETDSHVDASFLLSPVLDMNVMLNRLSNCWLGQRILGYWSERCQQSIVQYERYFERKRSIIFPNNQIRSIFNQWPCLVHFFVTSFAKPIDIITETCLVKNTHRIRIPTLILCARDDPFLIDIPVQSIICSPHQAILVTKCGGHSAFLDRLNLNFLPELLLEEFLVALVSVHHLPDDLIVQSTLKKARKNRSINWKNS